MHRSRTNAQGFIGVCVIVGLLLVHAETALAKIALKPADTEAGYIACLLINAAPFPGEKGWTSEKDTQAAMSSILWVIHGRIHHVPTGYRQVQIAAIKTDNIIDVITAGGERGQCDGFYKDRNGKPKAVARVHKRIDYLLNLANEGAPGRFARLMLYAQGLADAYVADGIKGADRYANLKLVGSIKVTGRAYSWMTDKDCYKPGGAFVRIPNSQEGSLGGNRFFTLKEP